MSYDLCKKDIKIDYVKKKKKKKRRICKKGKK